MAGSSFIPLPRFLLTKKGIVNVCNENDHYCFKWALISALKIVNRPQRCSAYNIDISLEIIRISDEIILDFTGLTFPLEIKCIKNFLKKNTHMKGKGNNWTTFSIGSGKASSYQYDLFGRRWKWTLHVH